MFLYILLLWGRHLPRERNFGDREEDEEEGEKWSALRSTALLILLLSSSSHHHHHHHHHSSAAGSQNSTGLTHQALLILRSANNCLTTGNVISLTAFCIRVYTAGRKFSTFELSCDLVRMKPTVDSANGIT